jgi:glucan 1,3-beta-glucosidase
MRNAIGAFLLSAAVIAAAWWWLGRPIALSSAPLAPGEKLECVSYAPYRDNETPIDLSTRIEPWRIEEDLRQLSAVTGCVRTYSVHQGLDQVAPIAQKLGMKVLQGLWLGRDRDFNKVQIDGAIVIANKYPDTVRAVVVGNEVLLRGELAPASLAEIVREVKRRVPVPVTYADVWEFWLKSPDLVSAVDFVTIHILPYWEDQPIPAETAADHVASIRRKVAQSFPGKDIMIGEVGWPSEGRMREGALPSPYNEARVLQDVIARAKQENFHLNVIEAFDQPWKRQFEGTVGGHWGLFDAQTRQPKFVWGQPVSNHPRWKVMAAVGIALAAIVFGAALSLSNHKAGRVFSGRVSLEVAACAGIGGVLIGITLERALIESFALGGVVRSAMLLFVAVLAPVVCAGALARRVPVPPLALVFARAAQRTKDRMQLAIGLMLAAVIVVCVQAALGLVFDPRYRDFPAAALTGAVVPFAVVMIARGREAGMRQPAETLTGILLAASAAYIIFNETLANWQAVWTCAPLVLLAVILERVRGARG